jgi:hypothetical protein
MARKRVVVCDWDEAKEGDGAQLINTQRGTSNTVMQSQPKNERQLGPRDAMTSDAEPVVQERRL